MPQEVIDQINELGKADGQPDLLTFYDRKGRLISESENPGVSELIDTIIPPDNGLGDFKTPTVNQDYGLQEEQDIDLPLLKQMTLIMNPKSYMRIWKTTILSRTLTRISNPIYLSLRNKLNPKCLIKDRLLLIVL